jgi:hypothetical protein
MAVQVERPWEFMAKGLDFGLWALEASHYARTRAPIPIFYWLFSAHFLASQQSLAIQSHALST